MKRELLAWVLVFVLAMALVYQAVGVSKQEARAELAEMVAQTAYDSLAAYKETARRELETIAAERNLALAEVAKSKAKLKRISFERRSEALAAVLTPSEAERAVEATQTPVEAVPDQVFDLSLLNPDIYAPPQPGDPIWPIVVPCGPAPDPDFPDRELVIGDWVVVICAGVPTVAAEAAVELLQMRIERQSAVSELAIVQLELAKTQTALEASRAAMVEWKKAARKSRFRRFIGVVAKPALLVVGIIIGSQLGR